MGLQTRHDTTRHDTTFSLDPEHGFVGRSDRVRVSKGCTYGQI